MKLLLVALLFITSAVASDLQLTWTDNATNEAGFAIERCITPVAPALPAFVEVARVAADVVSYTDTNLSPSTSYSYRIRAFNAGGYSSYSNIAIGTTTLPPPNAPSGATVLTITIAIGH